MGGFSKSLKAKGVGLGICEPSNGPSPFCRLKTVAADTAHGNLTCQRFPGSLGHEKQDAALYKEWGVSFVKNDWCWHNEPDQSKHLAAFNAMRDALNATGDPHECFWALDFVDQMISECWWGQACRWCTPSTGITGTPRAPAAPGAWTARCRRRRTCGASAETLGRTGAPCCGC